MIEWFFNYSTRWQFIVFLSSFVAHFEGNLLEGRQLFLGDILWWGAIFLGGNFSRGQLSSGAIVRVAIIRGAIIHGTIISGAIIQGAIFLGSNCPRTNQNYSNKQYLEIIHNKDHSWQGQFNLSDLLLVKLRKGLIA